MDNVSQPQADYGSEDTTDNVQAAPDYDPHVSTLPQKVVDAKAPKYHVALGTASPGIDTIASMLSNGQDDRIRQTQLQKNALDFQAHKNQMVGNIISSSPNGVDQDSVDFVRNMNQVDFNEISHASNVMETTYAKKFIQTIAAKDSENNFLKAEQSDPEGTHQRMDIAEYAIARQQIAQSQLDQVESDKRNQGWGGYIGDIAGSMLPLAAVRLNNLVKSAPATSLLPGANMQQQIDYLHSLPPDRFEKELGIALASIGNLDLREQFVSAVIQQSDSDASLTNLNAVVDVATLAEGGVGLVRGIGKALAKKAVSGAPSELTEALTSTLKAGVGAAKAPIPDPVKIAGQTGDFKTAAVLNSLRVANGDIPSEGEAALRLNARSINDPSGWFTGGAVDLSKGNVQDFERVARSNPELAEEFLNGSSVSRVSEPDRVAIRQEVYDRMIGGNPKSIQGNVLDVDSKGGVVDKGTGTQFVIGQNNLTNTETMRLTFGKANGEMFPNKATAVNWARNNLGQYKLDLTGGPNSNVRSVAGKWVVTFDHDLPDSLDNFKHAEVPVNDKFNEGFWNGTLKGFIGKARNQANILGQSNTDARKTVVHGSQRLFTLFREMLQPIAQLDKDARKRLGVILENNRNYVDRATGDRGMFFQSQGDFEEAYHAKFGTLPTDKDILAYYSYVQANQLDGMVRNAGWARDKIRMGLKNYTDYHNINYTEAQNATMSQKKVPLEFEGKRVHEIPWKDGHNTSIAVRNSDTGEVTIFSKRYATPEQKALITKELSNNGKIIQAADGHLPIQGVDKDVTVSHYVTGSAKEGRIKVNGPWKDGGHILNEHKFYVKQPNERGGYFAGDTSIATAPNAMIAKARAEAWDKARIMMIRGDAGLDAYTSKEIGLTGQEFADHFAGQRTANGIVRQGLDKDQPILWTRSGEQTIDRHKLALKQGQNPYNLYDIDRRFSGERDSDNIPALISEKDVAHIVEDGRLVDPYQTLTEAARSMVDIRLKRDYVLKSASQWVSQFQDILKPTGIALKDKGAVNQLFHPEYLDRVDKVLLNNAENARKSIIRFSGGLAKEEQEFETLKGRFQEMLYSKLGDKKYQTVENWLLPVLNDPARVVRNMAYHLKMGLGSPMHMFLQASTISNIAAISPRAALKGIPAYIPLRYTIVNPNTLDFNANVASKFGWDTEHFKEMYHSLIRSGWGEVHGDNAILNDISNPNIFKSKAGKILDAGAFLSDEGIRIHRLSAWATAYQEWRTANPLAKLTQQIETRLLSRADDMTANMSAANNANWQRGILSVPTQFFTFQLRTMEQYFGKTLTSGEKARLFAGQAALFGFPTAVGGAVGVWPVAESVKSYLQNHNIPHDDNATDALLNGIPQLALRLISGSDIDIGQRFGPQGMDLGQEVMNGDKSLFDLAVGVSGSTIHDIIKTTVPFIEAISSLVTTDPKDNIYPLDLDTLEQVTSNVTSLNTAAKMWYAWNTGRWMSKHGITQDEVTPFQAVFMGLTGANMSDLNDAYRESSIMKGRKELADEASQQVMDYLRRGMQSEDTKQRSEYFRVAKAHAVAGGLTDHEFSQAVRRSLEAVSSNRKDITAQRFLRDSSKRGYSQ